MAGKIALVLGASGLVGSSLTKLLLADDRFSEVRTFVRRKTGIENPKLLESAVDFDHLDGWRHLLKGDMLFSALGTTLKQAGNKAAQYKVDYTYQFNVAKAASENGTPCYV